MMHADAVLVPTRRIDNEQWFPDGPPPGARGVDRGLFTADARVQPAPGTPPDAPEVWLGWVLWEGEGAAPIEWFVSAAEQFVRRAFERFRAHGRAPLSERQLPLLALPVIGTGSSGAKPVTGSLLLALLLMLSRYAASQVCVAIPLMSSSYGLPSH